MLEPLRRRVVEALSAESAATLSTGGPGGIQAGFFPCEADGMTLFFLVPATADVLFNLGSETAVVVTTPRWQMEARADIRPLTLAPENLQLAHSPHAAGCLLVAAHCHRIHFHWPEGWGYRETIDCDPD